VIGESVFARCLSAQKDLRVEASTYLNGPKTTFAGDKAAMIADLKDALFAAKIISYAQGYNLMMEAAKEYGWKPELRRYCPDVAWWLHYPFRLPR
jgi:6-phosphogluconate dehydrogenase